jgi:hypothetical protein
MMHINVNVFSIPKPPMKKMCKGFYGCFSFLRKVSSTIACCSLLSFYTPVENDLYGKRSSTLLESIYVVNLFFKYLSFDFVLFSYFKSYGLIYLILVNNGFFFGLLTFHPFISCFFFYFFIVIANCPIHYYNHHFD